MSILSNLHHEARFPLRAVLGSLGAVVLFCACGSDDGGGDGQTVSPNQSVGVGGGAGSFAAGGATGVAGESVIPPGSGGTGPLGAGSAPTIGAGGGTAIGAGGAVPGAGGQSPISSGGTGFGAGGGAGTPGEAGMPGMAGAPGGAGAPPGVNEPVIPEPSGMCPEFKSGTQTIMGLSTEVLAGAPGPTKGPLLFGWHGTGGNGRLGMGQIPASVRDEIVQQGGIVIAPSSNGENRGGGDVTFVLNVWYDGGDLEYADLIVGCAVKNNNIDPRRIYTTGCSAGGLMAGVMSVMRSNYIAAAAPNSGGLAIPGYRLQDAMRVPAVMTMHGGDKDNVIINFQDSSVNLHNLLKPTGAFLVDCNHNIGHCGAPQSLHENAWEFMKAHPFGTRPSPYASGLPADFPDYCTIVE